ncbi:MAG: hypothetical protein H0X33_13160 [Taibaiella sp.]|nr:hypothetical protein [Taibaiella sp.]
MLSEINHKATEKPQGQEQAQEQDQQPERVDVEVELNCPMVFPSTESEASEDQPEN